MRLQTSLLTIAACVALTGCPPTDPLDMGMIDAGADARSPDAGPDMGPDMGPDAGSDGGVCDDPPDAAPPNPVPTEGYAGCFRDRFQVEAVAGDVTGLDVALTASLNADLGGPIDLGWWSGAPPAEVVVAPVVNPDAFLQVEFRDDDGVLTPVDFEWQCAVVERIQFQVAAARPNNAPFINVGRACPIVALGAIDEPSFDMQAWHLQSLGLDPQPGLPPLVPRGPTPGVNGGVDVVLIDSGIDPTLVEPLGIEILPSVIDAPLGVSETPERLSPHGSAMALLIRQLAPDARLHSVRVLGPDNIGSIPDLARALDAAHTLAGGICGGEHVPAGTCQTCPEEGQDEDGDGWCNAIDNCPENANPLQADADRDGLGDVCDDYACLPSGEATDWCNGVDDDCDRRVDEDPEHECGPGGGGCLRSAICVDGVPTCLNTYADSLELCNGESQECGFNLQPPSTLCAPDGDWCQAGRTSCDDGVNEVCTPNPRFSCEGALNCNPDELGQPCETGDPGTCAAGLIVCRDAQLFCAQALDSAQVDRCGDGDNDCDGEVDEDAVNGPCVTDMPGACAVGQWQCTDEGSICVATPAEEVCNGIDDNCDGQVDEGLDCTVCCENQGQHARLAPSACLEGDRRGDEFCEPKCCTDGVRRLAGDCDFFTEDESVCDVCCVEGQLTPVVDDAPMLVNLSLGWPPELSRPRVLKGNAGPTTMGNECVVEEGPVGASVRWNLERLARRNRNVAPTAVFAAAGNRPGRARDDGRGQSVNNLDRRYAELFKVSGLPDDPCDGAHPLPTGPAWFMPAGYGRTPSCPFGPDEPQYLTFALGGISDTDLPTVQSIDGAEPPLVGPGQHVYVDHPALRRRDPLVCDDSPTELDGLQGPFPFTGTSVPTALATGAAARFLGLFQGFEIADRELIRLLYYTGRPVDDGRPMTPRLAHGLGLPVHRMDVCRMEFAATDPRCEPLRDCIGEDGNDPDVLLPTCSAMELACLALADAPNGPCTERVRTAVPLNPDYLPDDPCQSASLCVGAWQDASMTCGDDACPFELVPDRHSMGTLSGTPAVSGCPDCYLNAVKARFEVLVNEPLNVVSATLIYDEAPNNYSIKYVSLPATQWYKGDSFYLAGLAGFANVCPSFAKLDLVHKDPQTGQYISDTSPIRVECQ